jgi:hypothetical protein
MAFNAVLIVSNTFFNVLSANLFRGVFVATVTGVLAVVVSEVASHTLNIVVAVKYEELVVIERGRLPPFLAVALSAITGNLLV